MRLFQKNTGSASVIPAENSVTPASPPAKNLSQDASELWANRYLFIAAYILMAVILLAWGFVLLPENGWFSWLWWPVTLVALLAGGGLTVWQLKRARSSLGPAEDAPLAKKLLGLGQRVPLGLL